MKKNPSSNLEQSEQCNAIVLNDENANTAFSY